MYDPPAYVWALTIGGPTAIAAATCIALYGGAVRVDVERLLTSPLLSSKVGVSGNVYDIATGRLTTTVDAQYP